MSQIQSTDVLVLGAGAAGLMCAIQVGKSCNLFEQRLGRVEGLGANPSIMVVDHAKKAAPKILISGGGRCNFTNLRASPANYVSENPHFSKSALARFRPEDFLKFIEAHQIAYHEKKLGQLFCDYSAQDIVNMLVNECNDFGIDIRLGVNVEGLKGVNQAFEVETSAGLISARFVVIATGGLSIPKIGASGIGYEIAAKTGHRIVPTHAALDGFRCTDQWLSEFKDMSGVSIDVQVTSGGVSFRENILFTHTGISGPAALQASLYWNHGESIAIDLLPSFKSIVNQGPIATGELFDFLLNQKKIGNKSKIKNVLTEFLPSRFLDVFLGIEWDPDLAELPIPQIPEKKLKELCGRLHRWNVTPADTVGYTKAEVTRGGVDTSQIASKTMESTLVPNLYFIGEVLDVTGWLGGYNFQWAWASAFAAGQSIGRKICS